MKNIFMIERTHKRRDKKNIVVIFTVNAIKE
jgi:hypothetical protein